MAGKRVPICCLCGGAIEAVPATDGDALSRDHVPPKQFYPKEMRRAENPNLWLVDTHKRCNNAYREDEEYFLHAAYMIVANVKPQMGEVIYRDLSRRTHQRQTPAMVRRVLKTFSRVTVGGIHLPAGILEGYLENVRVERVVIKIAQGLFMHDTGRFLPRENCKVIRYFPNPREAPDLYSQSSRDAQPMSVLPDVFSYRHLQYECVRLFSLMFWDSFMFWAAFQDPEVDPHSDATSLVVDA